MDHFRIVGISPTNIDQLYQLLTDRGYRGGFWNEFRNGVYRVNIYNNDPTRVGFNFGFISMAEQVRHAKQDGYPYVTVRALLDDPDKWLQGEA